MPVFKTEHKYQAIINSSKLVVRDKPSRQTTKAHTISNRKGNKNISPRQYKSKQLKSMRLCYAGLIQRAPKSRIHLRSTKPRTEGSGGRLFTSGFTFCLKQTSLLSPPPPRMTLQWQVAGSIWGQLWVKSWQCGTRPEVGWLTHATALWLGHLLRGGGWVGFFSLIREAKFSSLCTGQRQTILVL